jgi:NAD+ synthase
MQQLTKSVIKWIKDYFKDNADGKVICGISGGKDSTVVAALCVKALGADRVIGVLMPNGIQYDINDSHNVCTYLGIESITINIKESYSGLIDQLRSLGKVITPEIKTNLPSRLRMSTLYTVAALYPNSRVVNTSNFSERYIGYSTKYGDGAGDFSPLGNLTVREVLMIGDDLGLPHELVHKTPSDGMSGMSDEEKIGFTYDELDEYILNDKATDAVKEKIEKMHRANSHKLNDMPRF